MYSSFALQRFKKAHSTPAPTVQPARVTLALDDAAVTTPPVVVVVLPRVELS